VARDAGEAPPLYLIERCKIRMGYLHELVNDLLEYSCLQAVGTQEERNPLDLAAVVGAAVEELEPVARTENVGLTTEVQPCRVLGDEQQLLTLTKNLIGNALRYTPAGGRVAVRVRPVDRQAVLEVEDNGIGVDAMSLPFIFDEFFRAPNAKEYDAAGTGLGLTMCKSIAENHGGTIAVSSVPHQCTIFTVRIPRRP
jgi:signal transduction histidine kinase